MKLTGRIASVFCAALLLSSCGNAEMELFVKERTYADFDVAKELGIDISLSDGQIDSNNGTPALRGNTVISRGDGNTSYKMKVYEKMDIYENIGDTTTKTVLKDGAEIVLEETNDKDWVVIYDTNGTRLGYARDGFSKAINAGTGIFAELPIETGNAKTNEEIFVAAYSHLVDVRKYFNVYSSTNESNEGVDLNPYDIKVSMKLSTNDTSINEPFYNSNICMVQYDILPKLKKAVDMFRRDGYMIVIYDAYRPTSVQQRWFDVVRVHKWVADPSIGMGGIHDRGTALDISLIDIQTGKELEMPTPMHTFTEESARTSPTMTEKARENMDYMLEVMVQCGFTYINSEWWHFQDVDTQYYLPSDHPIDSIPLVPSEMIEKIPLSE